MDLPSFSSNNCFSGTQVLSTIWATESNILVGLHDASYSIWYCPGEACMDPTVVALTKVTVDITYVLNFFSKEKELIIASFFSLETWVKILF